MPLYSFRKIFAALIEYSRQTSSELRMYFSVFKSRQAKQFNQCDLQVVVNQIILCSFERQSEETAANMAAA